MSGGFRARPHSWQAGRWRGPLDVGSFQLDERRLDELIAFAAQFSHLIPFRGEGGETGRWDTFFLGDPARSIPGDISFIIADMASADPTREYLDRVGYRNDAAAPGLLAAIQDALNRLDLWRERLALAKAGKAAFSVEATLSAMVDGLIEGDKKFDTVDLRGLIQSLSENPEWREIAARDPTPSYWTSPSGEGNPFAPPEPLQIYGCFNRTTRIIAEQARLQLQASLNQPDHAPHAALLLSFLQLFARVQADANGITGKHLNFYFRTVLGLSRRAAEPDMAHVVFRAAPGARPFTLPRGARLDAGSDAAGAPIQFALDGDVEIGQAEVARISSLRLRRASQSVASILAWPIANSRDGFGAENVDPVSGWPPYRGESDPAALRALDAIEARVGVLIRSQCLRLRGAARRLTVTLAFASGPALVARVGDFLSAARAASSGPARSASDGEIVAAAFRFAFESAADDAAIAALADVSALGEGRLAFVFALGADAPESAPSGAPGLRITLNPASQTRPFAHGFFADLELTAVELDVAVRGLAPLTLQTPAGPIDASKPFLPFGPLAPRGAYLVFSHPDLRGKALGALTLNLEWSNLPVPPATLESVYAAYAKGLTSDDFRGTLSVLEDRRWTPVAAIGATNKESAAFPLFGFDDAGAVEPAAWSFDLAPLGLEPAPAATPAIWDSTCKTGFFRLQLTDPPFGFGQSVYPDLLTSTVMANAHAWPATRKPVPAAPVAPLVAAMSVDYGAHARLVVQRAPTSGDPARDEGVFRFGPFASVSEIADFRFLPDFADDGYLWLGVRNLDPARALSLFFHIEARASDAITTTAGGTAAADDGASLKLRYFSARAWKDLPDACLIRDTTERLTRPGLMSLQIPPDASGAPAPSAEDLVWLQIATARPGHNGRILAVRSNAATATRVGGPPANAGSATLPPGAIVGLATKNPSVLSVSQPLATENGRLAEDERQFQIRVSERLGHKQRAILPRDYESLILEKFPSIGDARCLTRKEANLHGAPRGQVVVIVAPLRAPGPASLEPRVPECMLRDIGDYLLQKCPASVDAIVVRNPDYEPIRVSARLDVGSGDRSQFLSQAKAAIDRLIAPWRDDPKAALPIGNGAVELADVLDALGNLEFKPEVHGLSLVHFYRDGKPLTPREEAARPFHRLRDTAEPGIARKPRMPWWPWSVLIPAPNPLLHWLDDGGGIGELAVEVDFALAWEGQANYKPPVRAGVGNLQVDVDFLVQAGVGNLEIGDDFRVG